MFVDFEKVFNKKNDQNVEIPEPLLAYMSKSLPEGLTYAPDHDGTCHIIAEDGELKISDLLPFPTKEQSAILGEDYSFDDVLAYMYNSQQIFQLKPKTPGIIVVNGEKIAAKDFIKNPNKNIRIQENNFYIKPSIFPEPVTVTMQTPEIQQNVVLTRVPNESVHIAKFESNPSSAFLMRFLVDGKKKTMQCTILLQLKNSKNVHDLITAIMLYNSFLDGSITMDGFSFIRPLEKNKLKMVDPKMLSFWKKVYELEKTLDVTFKLTMDDIDKGTACLVEQLYQSFVYKRPTKDRQRVESINGVFLDNTREVFNKNIKKNEQLFFMCDTEAVVDLLGVKLKLCGLLGICNALISDFKIKGNKYSIYFEDCSEDKPMFTSVLYFQDSESMIEYRESYRELGNDMLNAKSPEEYL